MEASKKSSPMMTFSQAPGMWAISMATSLVGSSKSTTWSESQRTGRVTCIGTLSKNSSSAESLSATFSVGWKWPKSSRSYTPGCVAA